MTHAIAHARSEMFAERQNEISIVRRVCAFLYGTVSYAIFFGTFLYAIGFVGNLVVPKSMDSTLEGPLGQALLVNIALLGLFALQHSVMAQPTFKRWWTKIVPHPVERSTYVLFSSAALLLLFWQWQPMGGIIWEVQNSLGRGMLFSLFAGGWLLVLVSTFLINHFDLFGLRQVYLYLRGKAYTPVKFRTPGPYQYVRHPLYTGWLLAFWATPTMTVTHLVFALVTTAYILIAIQLEERDLLAAHEEYDEYRRQVPMLLPRLFGKEGEEQTGKEVSGIFSKERIEEVVGVVFIVASFFLTGWFYYNLYQGLRDSGAF